MHSEINIVATYYDEWTESISKTQIIDTDSMRNLIDQAISKNPNCIMSSEFSYDKFKADSVDLPLLIRQGMSSVIVSRIIVNSDFTDEELYSISSKESINQVDKLIRSRPKFIGIVRFNGDSTIDRGFTSESEVHDITYNLSSLQGRKVVELYDPPISKPTSFRTYPKLLALIDETNKISEVVLIKKFLNQDDLFTITEDDVLDFLSPSKSMKFISLYSTKAGFIKYGNDSLVSEVVNSNMTDSKIINTGMVSNNEEFIKEMMIDPTNLFITVGGSLSFVDNGLMYLNCDSSFDSLMAQEISMIDNSIELISYTSMSSNDSTDDESEIKNKLRTFTFDFKNTEDIDYANCFYSMNAPEETFQIKQSDLESMAGMSTANRDDCSDCISFIRNTDYSSIINKSIKDFDKSFKIEVDKK